MQPEATGRNAAAAWVDSAYVKCILVFERIVFPHCRLVLYGTATRFISDHPHLVTSVNCRLFP